MFKPLSTRCGLGSFSHFIAAHHLELTVQTVEERRTGGAYWEEREINNEEGNLSPRERLPFDTLALK